MAEEHTGQDLEAEDAEDIPALAAEALANPNSAVWDQGIPPNPNCPEADDDHLNGLNLPEQVHHLASIENKKVWTPLFKKIADRYGVNLQDGWNKLKMRHRGSHPREYHHWVHQNMMLADEIVTRVNPSNPAAMFQQLFETWVRDVVDASPLIVRLIYWKCRRW